ncbi:hypothetical protein JMA_39670 (plasmid) [Jeotgalibacillus malaysiensis]|uniref:Lipoprotein n=1 Tax=Jeotgalibacillus malaysiensis TaxID=1508404 RepID=A0A0B5ASW0_9BACL|nr:hypothetical protein JMA_39670 [Jeotgalibacillus malaysiensis]
MVLKKQYVWSLLVLPGLLLGGCATETADKKDVGTKVEKTVETKQLSEFEKKIQNEELRAIDVMRLYDVNDSDSFVGTEWKKKIEDVRDFKIDFEQIQGRLASNHFANPGIHRIDNSMRDSLREYALDGELMAHLKRFKELRAEIYDDENQLSHEESVKDFYENKSKPFIVLHNELVDFEQIYAGNDEMEPLERVVYEVVSDSYWAFLASVQLGVYYDENFRSDNTGEQSVIKGMNEFEEKKLTYHYVNLNDISEKLEEVVMTGW